MFTKNYYKMMKKMLVDTGLTVKGISYQNYEREIQCPYIYYWNVVFPNKSSAASYNLCRMDYLIKSTAEYAGVLIGTGTTPPTIDDYKLSGEIISNFTYSSALSIEETDGGFTATVLFTITNTGSEAFTIGEIGMITNADKQYSSKASETYKYLIERTVLDEPLTIEAGGVGLLTYTINYTFPFGQ